MSEDDYITSQVRKAFLSNDYVKTEEKLRKLKEEIIQEREKIEEIEKIHPKYKNSYMKKYMEARKKHGLPEEIVEWEKFLTLDLDFEK
jgi:hypothetical protein